MGMITSLSDLTAKLTGQPGANPQHLTFWFDSRIQAAAAPTTFAGFITSLWRFNKSNGQNGAIPPTTPEAPTNLTIGALPHKNPASGKQLWMLGVESALTAPGVVLYYDRLLHVSGLRGDVNTAQAVGGAITRNTGGEGNEIWLEVYSQIGATLVTVTAVYVNQAGVTKTTPPTQIGSSSLREEARMIRMTLADGDTGVRSVTSITLSGTATATGTQGNLGVVIARPLSAVLNEGPGAAGFRDYIAGIPSAFEIPPDACLAFAFLAATNTSSLRGFLTAHMVEA